MSTQKNILVMGATGRVGRQVVEQLAGAGAGVRALVRDPQTAGLAAHVRVGRGDLTDPGSLRAALSGVDAVFVVWPFATAEGLPEVVEVVAEHARRWSTCPRRSSGSMSGRRSG